MNHSSFKMKEVDIFKFANRKMVMVNGKILTTTELLAFQIVSN